VVLVPDVFGWGSRRFPLAGAQAAHDRITAHYAEAGAPDGYTGRLYDGHHKFDQAMQRDAFGWLAAQLY
jgi:hypothetical protein